MQQTKAGARHSGADMADMQTLHDIAVRQGATCAASKAVQVAPDAHPGAMVALMLSPEQQQALRDASGMSDAEADHITLAYLGPDAATLLQSKNALIRALADVAVSTPPIDGECGGVARFAASESSDGQDVIVALYDSAALPELHAPLCAALELCGIERASNHGFTPHITLAYIPADAATPVEQLPRVSLPVVSLSLIWAGERIDFPLQGRDTEEMLREALDLKRRGRGASAGGDDDEDMIDEDAEDGEYKFVYAPVAEVKAIGDYTLKVRGIVRGGHDLVGDTFTTDTDLGFDRSPVGMPVFYDHAQRGVKSQVGKVIAWEDTGDAIDFTVELDRARRYVRDIMQLGAEKALGGSTGAVGHLVVRDAGMLKRWIVGELSLTPTPAEPRTRADLHDTKSADTPELDTETGRSPVVAKSVLPALVSIYTTFNLYDIKARLERVRRQP